MLSFPVVLGAVFAMSLPPQAKEAKHVLAVSLDSSSSEMLPEEISGEG